MDKILLVASKTGYQVREFYSAAESLGVELVLATDRCHVLDDPWRDDAVPIRFEDPYADLTALKARGPFDGILAVGDTPAKIAAQAAELLGLKFHPPHATRDANDKFLTREKFRQAGLNVPSYMLLSGAGDPGKYPCVLKPLHLSASRGVIRADSPEQFEAALARIRKITPDAILVEDFIPGREFAIEGLMTDGDFKPLALFDKPDPLVGPFFEETIYTTPSREPAEAQAAIIEAVRAAVKAIGLYHGPIHAEARVNDAGVWMLEAAARPIGGLCARVLNFSGHGHDQSLEELLLRHASGEDVSAAALAPGAHGVMMIPIERGGVYLGVEGVDNARLVAGIQDVVITAKQGQSLVPLPEGASYLGFLFARGATPSDVEKSLRKAHSCLSFHTTATLAVVR